MFKILQPAALSYLVTSRHGGVSEGPFKSLNVAFGIGDDNEAVRENRRRVQLASKASALVSAKQVHGAEVVEVHELPASLPECDALMTRTPGLGLMIQHADCQAAIIYDPIQHALALVHSGWRGSVLNIYRATIEKMEKAYKSQAKDLLVCIGPSLGPKHAEFVNYRDELPQAFWNYQVKTNDFDFWAISRDQLLELGVKAEHIEIAQQCTYSQPKNYFSYRRDGLTGRMATVATLS